MNQTSLRPFRQRTKGKIKLSNCILKRLIQERLQEFYPDFVIPTPVQIGFVAQQRSLKVSWLAQDGSNQNCNLLKSKANQPSNYKGGKRFRSWSAFREFAVGLEPHRFIFRGQPHPYRLRTGFHRTKRKDMLRFLEEDMPHLHRLINAQTTHYFDFQDRLRTGAFWNLIQHHGYPTPLLDWTHSPFVAAYFAYRRTFKSVKPNQKVRIFMFDRKEWQNDLPQFDSIAFTRPHLSILETIAIENNRAISQQALFTVSSVDDIEGHIAQLEKLANKRYLQVFDLPAVDRENVMRELSLMGITARTMFPGLDGACEELRERFF